MSRRRPWWRRFRQRRPDLASPLRRQAVVVVDATGKGRGPAALEHLRRSGVPAAAGDMTTVGGADVLLPILSGLAWPAAVSTDAVELLDADSVDVGSPFAPARLVLAWFVEDGARPALATPGVGGDRCANGAALLLGDAWSAELRRHGAAVVEAATCRSDRLRALLDDDLLGSAGFELVVEAHRAAARLDPHHLTALSVEVIDRLDEPPTRHWCGEDGVAAAVVARRAEPRGDPRPGASRRRSLVPDGSAPGGRGTRP